MKTIPLFILLAIVILSACKKEDNSDLPITKSQVYDTIFPSSYFPAYPGSYWVYNNGDTMKTKSNYELRSIFEPMFDMSTGVPFMDSCAFINRAFYPIYNNSVLNRYTIYNSRSAWCSKLKLLDENIGSWTISSTKQSWEGMSVELLNTIINLPNNISYDSVIVMAEIYEADGYDVYKIEHYYAKNIGLIGSKTLYNRLISLDSAKWDKYLTSYMINFE